MWQKYPKLFVMGEFFVFADLSFVIPIEALEFEVEFFLRGGRVRGGLGLERREGLPTIGCKSTAQKTHLSTELPTPAKECRKRTIVYLRLVPPKTSTPTA